MTSSPLGDDPDRLLTPVELAAHLRVKPSTVERWRRVGYGPPVTRAGGSVRYTVGGVRSWLEAQSQRDTEATP